MTAILEQKDIISLALSNSQSIALPVVSAAKEALSNMTWPASGDESWKYTKLNHIKALELNTAEYNPNCAIANTVEYINGSIVASPEITGMNIQHLLEDNLAKTAFIENLGRISPWEKNLFSACNLIAVPQVLFIENQNTSEIKNLVINVKSDVELQSENLRFLIIGRANSSTKIEVNFNGLAKDSLRNLQIECIAEDNANIELNLIQENEPDGNSVFQFDAELNKAAQVKINHFNISANWLRANSNFLIKGEGADAQVNGIYLPSGNQHIDHHTFIEHAVPHTTSHEWFKGVVSKNSKAVFNGKVFVKKDAQKTDAFQKNNNVIIDHTSSVDAKPELEIYADDVKCSHGCTIGQLDDEAIYYLRSRGIGQDKAKSMVLGAFCQDVLDLISNDELRERV